MEDEKQKDLEVLWTVEQVAEYFTVSRRTVYHWISAKKIFDPSKVIKIGNAVRIPRGEVERVAINIRAKVINKI